MVDDRNTALDQWEEAVALAFEFPENPVLDAAAAAAEANLLVKESALAAKELECMFDVSESVFATRRSYADQKTDPLSYVSFTETDTIEMVSDSSHNSLIRSKAGTSDPSANIRSEIKFSTDIICHAYVVGGGGSGSTHRGGGGGAGTLGIFTSLVIPKGTYEVVLGRGGSLPSTGDDGVGSSGTATQFYCLPCDTVRQIEVGGGGHAGATTVSVGGSTGGGDYYNSKPPLDLKTFTDYNFDNGFSTAATNYYRYKGGTATGSGNTGSGGGGGGYSAAGNATVFNGGEGGHGFGIGFNSSTIRFAAGGGGGSHNVQYSTDPTQFSRGGQNAGAAPVVPSYMYGSGGGGGAQSNALGAAGTDGAVMFKFKSYKGPDGTFTDFPTTFIPT